MRGIRPLGLAAAILALAVLAEAALAAAPAFPSLGGRRVVDEANILSPAAEAGLTAKLLGLEAATGRQLVVATLPSLGGLPIEDYGYQLGRHWGIGQKGRNDGALLLVAPAERAVRIEVGYGLEGVLTDALSSVIINSAVLPRFRAGDMEAGVVAGTDALVQQLSLDDGTAKARVAEAEAAAAPDGGGPGIPAILIVILILFFMFGRGLGGRRRGAGALPWIILGGLGGGGRGGGWSGGGGFSGGGGSFGGGGASGRW